METVRNIIMQLNLGALYGTTTSKEVAQIKLENSLSAIDDNGQVKQHQSFKISRFVNAKVKGSDKVYRSAAELKEQIGDLVTVQANARFNVVEYDWKFKGKSGHTSALQLVGIVILGIEDSVLSGLEDTNEKV